MKTANFIICFVFVLTQCVGAASIDKPGQEAASRQISHWQKQSQQYVDATTKSRRRGCTSRKLVRRKEWGSLSKQSRLDYITAVQCLRQKQPALSSRKDVPGARTRFDDWQAIHIILTNNVHFSGLFLHFHRYFIWLYEKALRDECGYKGTQPYWDWTISWEDPRKSTVFDGSPTSMGGNGEPLNPHNPLNISAFGINATLPPGTGGGCVETGPFANATVNLGPIAFQPQGPDGGLGYNPRCLTRDLNLNFSNQTKPTDVVRVISSCADLGCFDTVLEALDSVHAGGHFTMGGIESDAYASPGDPAFFLHHAMVDRVWSIWQNLNPGNRTKQVFGTSTAFNYPPSANVTLETEVDFDVLAPRQSIKSLVSTIDGPFCYDYA